jgi:hypothetical protein
LQKKARDFLIPSLNRLQLRGYIFEYLGIMGQVAVLQVFAEFENLTFELGDSLIDCLGTVEYD